MLTIGLTGGIGSGKSAASYLFEQKGIVVVDADICARIVVEPETAALKKIENHFGSGIIQANNGRLDRPKLRKIIFTDPLKKIWLENLLHPLISTEISKQLSASKSHYTILSSPLLLETQQKKICDRVLLIDVPVSTQISRACLRDASSEETIKSIISSQMPRKRRRELANDIIDNNQGLDELSNAIDRLHLNYLTGNFNR